jgi:TRAP-type uncharacterized transport system substrate-binding protein
MKDADAQLKRIESLIGKKVLVNHNGIGFMAKLTKVRKLFGRIEGQAEWQPHGKQWFTAANIEQLPEAK